MLKPLNCTINLCLPYKKKKPRIVCIANGKFYLAFLQANGWGHELQEILKREGIDISLRTIQRDLNQIAVRFPIESNKTVPQGWRWRSDAPIQSLPHMTSSQAVTFMMVEEHLRHLLPPSLLEENDSLFDLDKRSLSTQNNVRQWINRVRIVPANQP